MSPYELHPSTWSALRQLLYPPALRIASPTGPPDLRATLDRMVAERALAPSAPQASVTLPTPTVDRLADERLLADLATALFRAQRASDDAAPRVADDPAQRRPNARRHIDTAADALARAGVRTLDFTGRPYDPGLLGVQALAIEPRPGLTRETVIETVRPGVYVHDACIQEAQVLVGVPVAPVAGHPSTQETT